jgi:hypothetical protein
MENLKALNLMKKVYNQKLFPKMLTKIPFILQLVLKQLEICIFLNSLPNFPSYPSAANVTV